MAYCNQADLEEVYPNLSDLFQRRVLAEDWALTSGQTNTYQQEGLGYVETVWDDGEALTSQTSVANVESNPGSFFDDTTNDILYVHAKDSDDLTNSPPTIQIGVDQLTHQNKAINAAMEIMDSYLGGIFIVPLQPRLIKTHSTNDYDAIIRLACANLACSLIVRKLDPGNDLAQRFEQVALGFNPSEGEEMGYIAKIKAGEIYLQDQITPREADGSPNVIPSASNSGTGYIRIQPKISRYTGSTYQMWRLQIEDTDGAPGTALYKLSYDTGANWDLTGQATFNEDDNNRRIHIGAGIYVVFWGTFVAGDYWDIELFPTTDEAANSKVGSIELSRGL